jgi:acetyl esterase/lipase
LYLHGGAYALGSINTHRELVARLARATRMRGLAINYRLAPEHPFPAALHDATAAYGWLLTQGVDPFQIIIAANFAPVRGSNGLSAAADPGGGG